MRLWPEISRSILNLLRLSYSLSPSPVKSQFVAIKCYYTCVRDMHARNLRNDEHTLYGFKRTNILTQNNMRTCDCRLFAVLSERVSVLKIRMKMKINHDKKSRHTHSHKHINLKHLLDQIVCVRVCFTTHFVNFSEMKRM